MRPFVEIQDLARRYPDPGTRGELSVFEHVSFGVTKGEVVSVIGHSGCGKSTILNILAGLDRPSSGVVVMGGVEVKGPHLDRGVVFQNHSLLPWLTTLQNVCFGVRARWPQWSRAKIVAHAREYLSLVGLTAAEDRKPAQLSGGMRQRVGIARAFATQPKLLLLDEPFGALDALTRGLIQDELVKICAATEQTVFMITHDVDEAILLSDRVLLMSNGPRAQIAEAVLISIPRPRERLQILHHPAYYLIRNHLVDFLVTRSRELNEPAAARLPTTPEPRPGGGILRYPPEIDPAATLSLNPTH